MIRYKNYVIEDYFIDEETAVITDINGNVKNQVLHHGRAEVCINAISMPVHCIQAHTAWGYNPELIVHHDDWNPLNNALKNLKYITPEIHNTIHHKNKKVAKESIEKGLATKKKNNKHWNLSDNTKKIISLNITERNKQCKWYTNGIEEKFCKECPKGYVEGRAPRTFTYTAKDSTKKLLSEKIKERNKKCKWYTNGIEEKFCSQCPDGWEYGRLKRKK